jgi:hypothetical protein
MVLILPFDLYIKFTKTRINFLNLRMNSQNDFHSFYLFVLDYGLPRLWSHILGDYHLGKGLTRLRLTSLPIGDLLIYLPTHRTMKYLPTYLFIHLPM